ncbi:hypothetical protein ACFZDP_12220 [Streptomyces mirabilis]|uniref:hypothetical protein n=1 Tax=Streptomyces mirabilis TaxID=68239 RepID=UPI0036E31C29
MGPDDAPSCTTTSTTATTVTQSCAEVIALAPQDYLYDSTDAGTWKVAGAYGRTTPEPAKKGRTLTVKGTLTRADWETTKYVQFGRRLYQGAYGEYADGRLSDVRLYPTALPPADAAAPGGNATLTQLD